ncbi:MAG: NAD(P)/FAD-dependent oxidoreductase [Solirubrobacteraceae bacterium]
MTAARFDAVVIGSGPAGEVAVGRLAEQGLHVALCERELIGGECAYWACIPSKTLLRPAEVRAEARRAAGVGEPRADWPQLSKYRDFMIRNLDDSDQASGYRDQGIEVYRGKARISRAGQVEVAGSLLETERIVIATGSEQHVPAIRGLEQTGYWTNREATTLHELPSSIVILGGGPVGVELGQFFARFGTSVILVQSAERLVAREDPAVGELVAAALREDGIDLRLGVKATAARREAGERVLTLDDGSEARGQELLIATGRIPRVAQVGLENVGIEAGPKGIQIDERCRAGEEIWAVGDVTGVMPFTHVGMYQARIACADIAGGRPRADYSAIPRVAFTDPEIAAVGLTEAEAREQNLDLTTSRVELADSIARPWTYEEHPRGALGLIADRRRKVLVGAWAVAPLAGEWIHQAALAIKAEIPLHILRDTVAQFPTFSEAYLKGVERLDA